MAVMKANTSSIYFTNATNSKNGIKRETLSFSNFDASLVVFSMFAIVAHLVTDTILVLTYYLSGHRFWALSTVALALIPAIIIQAFSIRWHILDEAASFSKWLSHCCLFGVFFRHVDALQTGLEARRSGDVAVFQSLFHQQSDISMLQLFESFMKSAPQLVLQLYIMIQVRDWGPWTGLSAGVSLISLAWAMASYTHAMRQARPDKQKATVSGLSLQAVWRAGLLVARIAALVLFAICCQAWIFLLLGIHWLGMTVWVVLQKTDLCSTPWEECAYNGVVGVVYCFCFFNLREGRARGRMLAFYVVTVTQNLTCLYLFLALAQHTYPILSTVAAGAIVGGTIIGLCAMLTYYRFFHPSGPITLFGPPIVPTSTHTQSVQNNERSSLQTISSGQTQVVVERSPHCELQSGYAFTSQMPSDVEKSNSLRSLKHLWSVDRDGSLCSRSDEIPGNGGSPQPDEGCTDRRLLLSSRTSTRRPPSSDSIQMPLSASMEPSKPSNLISISSQNNGLSQSSIGNQSTTSNLTSRTTLNSQCHQSPPSNRQGWSSQSLHAALSNQSVHSTNTSHSTVSGNSNQSNHSSVPNRPPQMVRTGIAKEEVGSPGTSIDVDDSKLSWNCTSMMEDTQQSEIFECVTSEPETIASCGINKRRGICSSMELGLDKLEENDEESESSPAETAAPKLPNMEDSFARLCHKLVSNAEVKHLGSVASSKKEVVKRSFNAPEKEEREGKEEKRESDYIDSKQSAISSDGTASEVLSAHDYENICAVNIAREAWGLRSWQGYSDIETWLHDDSVVRDRRRDTLASIGTTTLTSASSERSTASESPPPLRQQWESGDMSAPPLPCRRPRQSYNRMDDYLDTLALDLAEIEQREVASSAENRQDNVFVAQPYVVDQHGMLYPLPASLDTILEELEDSSVSASTVTAVDIGLNAPGWASSLVATIDEIRMESCNPEDSGTVSESDFEVGSYRSLQLDSSVMANLPCQESPNGTGRGHQHFSNSLPSLLQAPRSWSHLTPEEVLFLSELKPLPESEFTNDSKHSPPNSTIYQSIPKMAKRPRRKFSILREKFEPKCEKKDEDCDLEDQNTSPDLGDNRLRRDFNERRSQYLEKKDNVGCEISLAVCNSSTQLKVPSDKSDIMHIKSESSSSVSPFKETDLKGSGWSASDGAMSLRSHTLLQQVITQPKLVPHNKKLSFDSNASA